MKNLFLYFIAFSFVTHSHSQADMLKGNDWYIVNLVIDGVDYLSPTTNAMGIIEPNIVFDDNFCFAIMDTNSDSFFANIIYDDPNEEFTFTEPAITLNGCEAYCEFTTKYFEFLAGDFDTVLFRYGLGYVFDPPYTYLHLVIFDENDNYALYQDSPFLGVSEFNNEQAITLSPNPTKDVFYINWDLTSQNDVTIYNTVGEKMKVTNANNQGIDVSSFPIGIYFVTLNVNGKRYVQKLIKQ